MAIVDDPATHDVWDEYVVGMTNRRSVPVDIESVVLIDPLGEKLVPGADPWKLEQLSEANWEKYARVGMYVLGAGAAGQPFLPGRAGAAANDFAW